MREVCLYQMWYLENIQKTGLVEEVLGKLGDLTRACIYHLYLRVKELQTKFCGLTRPPVFWGRIFLLVAPVHHQMSAESVMAKSSF